MAEHEIQPDAAPREVRLDYPRAEIRMLATTKIERKVRARSCKKEPWTVEWLEEHVQPGDVLYDIGANVGAFTLIAAVARHARVVAFEPGYANYARLCDNVLLNGCAGEVIPVPLLLTNQTGLVEFVYRGVEPGQSRHQIHGSAWTFAPTRTYTHARQATCAITLDAACAQFALPPPNHIKLDVDGAELLVLQGSAKTLAGPPLRSLLVEVDAENWDDVHRAMTEAGLELATRIARDEKPAYAVFIRPRRQGIG